MRFCDVKDQVVSARRLVNLAGLKNNNSKDPKHAINLVRPCIKKSELLFTPGETL